MNPITLCFVVAFLTVTGFLTLGCVGTHCLRGQLDAATRLQRTALIGVLTVIVLHAIIASVPSTRYPFLPSLQRSGAGEETVAGEPSDKLIVAPVTVPEPALPFATTPALPTPAGKTRVVELAASVPAAGWGTGLWIAGSVLSVLYLGYGHLMLVRLRRRSQSVIGAPLLTEVAELAKKEGVRCPEVRLHPDGEGPLLAGVYHPTLYVPAVLPENDGLRQMLLRHEIVHLARRDVAFLLGARILCALTWWHPLAHLLARRMEQTAEEACDARAVGEKATASASMYTKFLLQHAKRGRCATSNAVTVGIGAPRSQVGRRITRLLAGTNSSKPSSVPMRVGIVTAALLLAALGGIVQSSLSAPPSPQRSPAVTPPSEDKGYVPSVAEFREAFATSPSVAGTKNSGLQVIEFSDFECPSCRRANQPVPWRLVYPNVQTQFRHLPLTQIHPNANRAAILSGLRDSFWKTHDRLFSGRDLTTQVAVLEREDKQYFKKIMQNARKALKQNHGSLASEQEKETFVRSVVEAYAQRQINKDKALATKWHVNSTPVYFVLSTADNSVHRFIGNGATRAYLDAHHSRASQRTHQMNNSDARITFDVRDTALTRVLDLLFQQVSKEYKVEPGLDLANVKVTTNFSNKSFLEALGKLQEASPVPFAIRPSSGDSKVISLIPLPPHGMITGRLVYPDGRPAIGYEIYADRWNQDLFLPRTTPNQGSTVNPDAEVLYGERTLTDSEGRFTLRRLGNFRYNISASLPSVNNKSVAQDWVAPAIPGVRPKINQTTDVGTIQLSRGGIVRGRVTSLKGEPLSNFYVGSHGPHRPDTSGSVYPTETDSRGYYQLRLPAGRSYVYIGMQGYRQEPTHFTIGEGENIIVNMVAKPDAAEVASPVAFNSQREEENTLASTTPAPQYASGNLTGRIVFDIAASRTAQKPNIEFFEVFARVSDADRWMATNDPKKSLKSNLEAEVLNGATSAVASDGTFTLKNLGPFRYRIFVHQRTFYKTPMVQEWVAPIHWSARVKVRTTGDVGTIHLTPGVVVRGRVTDNDGKPRPNVEIRGDQGSTFGYLGASTDAKGRYALYLPPGRSRVSVASLTLKAPETRATLTVGEQRTFDFKAEPR